jgi:hypothetical protein
MVCPGQDALAPLPASFDEKIMIPDLGRTKALYVNAYNDRAEPFVWTKKKVRQRRFKGRRITQL